MNTTSASDAERDVEHARGRLNKTVEALKEKMTPSELFEEASRTMGSAGQWAIEQAKANPVPFALIGVGLAWLLAGAGRNSKAPPATQTEYARSIAHRQAAANGGENLGDRLSGMGRDAADAVSETYGAARDKVAEGYESAAQTVGAYTARTRLSLREVLENDPLIAGAASVVVGMAIGAALPATETETRLMAPVRDSLVEGGSDLARKGLDTAGATAEAALQGVKSELQRPADGADAADRAENAARAGVRAAREHIEGAVH